MRCKACNAEINKVKINRNTGEEEELCEKCLTYALPLAYDINIDEDIINLLDKLEGIGE